MKLNEALTNLMYRKLKVETQNFASLQFNNSIVKGNPNIEITSITHDSRQVSQGALFAAISGYTVDGNQYIEEAIKKGAVALITEKEFKDKNNALKCQIIVPDSREALGEIAGFFYGYPSRKFDIAGITGTNGKTTTSYIIESILKIAGKRTGIIGTISYKIGEDLISSTHTTPDAVKFQSLLYEMGKKNTEVAIVEVSSHALAQKRIWGTEFSLAIFTNLTHDHLDFHKTMENYGNAKLELFSKYLKSDGTAIVNNDDPFAQKIINSCKSKRIITYGFTRGSNVMAFNIAPGVDGTTMSICTPEGVIDFKVKLIGLFNVYNIMAAVASCIALGIDMEIIYKGLEEMEPIPGRFEYVEGGQVFPVIVDYAHTPDGLMNVLETILALFSPENLIVVFGATGDRDRLKRPEMGKLLSKYSDYMIITSDDPHSEDPDLIADEVISGILPEKKNCYEKILDRKEAIQKALFSAGSFDVVLIAGKGHEKKQIFKDREIEFNDKDTALEILNKIAVNCKMDTVK